MRQDGVSSNAVLSSAASSVIAVTSAVDRVYADIVSCICDYLPFDDLVSAASLSTVWRSGALRRATSIDRAAIVYTDAQLVSFIASPLRHYVSTLRYMMQLISYSTLASLLAAAPRLLRLTIRVDASSDSAAIDDMPKHGLKQLYVQLCHPSFDNLPSEDLLAERLVIVMQFVCCLTSLQELSVTVSMPSMEYDDAQPLPIGMLDPLMALASLSKLRFRRRNASCERLAWQQQHFDVIRSMPQLTSLDMCDGAYLPQELEWLLRAPHQLRLSEMDLRYVTIDAAAAALIGGVPTLTKFEPSDISAPSLSFLSHLPLLEDVRLECDVSVDLASLIAALHTSLPSVASLELCHLRMTSAHLVAALPHMPKLERLTLFDMELLTDLACLEASPHLATTLVSLTIFHCHSLVSSALQSIKTLRALEKLCIDLRLAPLTAFERRSFTPGKSKFAKTTQHALPMLRKLIYHRRE